MRKVSHICQQFLLGLYLFAQIGQALAGSALSEIDRHLENHPSSVMDPAAMHSIFAQHGFAQASISELGAIAVQGTHPLAAAGAITLIRSRNSALAFEISVVHLWAAESVVSETNAPFLDALSAKIDQPVLDRALSHVQFLKPRSWMSAYIVIDQLPVGLLASWLLSAEGNNAPITIRAAVLDNLLPRRKSLQEVAIRGLIAMLPELRNYGALPLAVYLLNIEDRAGVAEHDIEQILLDESLEVDLQRRLIRRYPAQVRAALTKVDLGISEARKEKLSRLLPKTNE